MRSKTLPQAEFISAEDFNKGSHPTQLDGEDAVAATLILEGDLTRKRLEG